MVEKCFKKKQAEKIFSLLFNLYQTLINCILDFVLILDWQEAEVQELGTIPRSCPECVLS